MDLRSALVEALTKIPPGTPGRVSKAAAAAGVKRETASRKLSADPTIEDEAARRRAAIAIVPQVVAGVAKRAAQPELVDAIAAGAIDAVDALRKTLAIDSEAPGVLLAKNGAAKLLLELAGRPAPGVLRARAEDGEGRAVEVEGSGLGLEGLLAKVLGNAGPAG
jgi:hypothetical protein